MRVLSSTLLVLLAAVAGSVPALAQVKESEPFGGRPFGAPPGTQADTAASASSTQGSTMGGPGVSSVTAPGTPNMGNAPPVVAAPVTVPAPAPVLPQVTTPLPALGTTAVAPATTAPTAAMQAPGSTAAPVPTPAPQPVAAIPAPAAAGVVPPFGVGQNPSRNAPPAVAASTAQQPPARGLPADAPKLVISGSVYSPDPARRLLIVNGQVMREGADLGQGLVLREVKQDSAVLGFKGSNYNVVF